MKTKKIIKKTIIEPYEFYYTIFEGTLYLPKCEEIGSIALFKQKFEGNLNLLVCKKIGEFAFSNSKFSGYLDLPDCEEIGAYAFCYSEFIGDANLQNCAKIGAYAFYYSYFSGILNIKKCEHIGFCAFKNSNFSEINIAYNTELKDNCIGKHSSEFINFYNENGKRAGIYKWNGITVWLCAVADLKHKTLNNR